MICLPKRETKLMVAVHGWSGVVLGLLLYAVVLTGTAAVFADEIGAWSAGHLQRTAAFARPVDATVRALAARTPARYHEGVDLYEAGDRALAVFFHRHETAPDGTPIGRGISYRVEADGRVSEAKPATDEEAFGPRNDDALSKFLVDAHVRLYLPNPWGLLLTGILGLAMLVAVISGVLIHRHLFRDVFTLRRSGHRVLAGRDRHSVAGTWSLPFAFALAFTGSFFSFFGTIGVPIVAAAAFGGDAMALSTAVYGSQAPADARAAAPGDLDRVLADILKRAGSVPNFVAIEHYGRADARIISYQPPREGDIEPPTLVYDGASGRFERKRPAAGTKPSVGGSAAGIMAPLHFGNFAGILSKAIWFALGFAMCHVTLTGLRLWLVRREEASRALGWLDRTTSVVGLGLPLALACAAVAFLIAMPRGSAMTWTPAGFLLGAAAVAAAAVAAPTRQALNRLLVGATAAALLLLPPLRLLCGGPGWRAAIAADQPIVIALDCAFLLAGLCLAREIGKRPRDAETGRTAPQPVLQAAE